MAVIEVEGLVKVYRSRKSEVRSFESLAWTIAPLVVFVPLAIRKYRAIDRQQARRRRRVRSAPA